MTRKPFEPVCPHCFYSFDGLQPDEQSRATCPECGIYGGPIDAGNTGALDHTKGRQEFKDFLLMCLGVLILFLVMTAAVIIASAIQ